MTGPAHNSRIRACRFRPARWLPGRHLQTIYPALPWARAPRPLLTSEWLELPDGDVTVVDWLPHGPADPEQPILIILHGLEGSAKSSYCRQLLHAAARRGWRAAVLHFRDCGDYRNRLPRRYHAGETDDVRFFLDSLSKQGQRGPIMAAGYSLGGNVLLKYLGESGDNTPLAAAAAVSVPLDLQLSSEALNKGFSKLYQSYLLKRMKKSVARKFDPDTAAFDWPRAMAAHSFAEFDDAVTAPLHGFSGKDDYYGRCSASPFLKQIQRPTLIINALDDPFMTPEVIPDEAALADQVTLEISKKGGHVGFIDGGTPWQPRYFLPRRIVEFMDSVIVPERGLP
ncbi:MAG TPA: hydrolase [Woeseiaceae bacterium]|nr:hydrolase [Woeseiaceae bacterium]